MKHVLFSILMLFTFYVLPAQDSTPTDVQTLETKTTALQTNLEELQAAYTELQTQLEAARQNAILADSTAIDKPLIKAPSTIDEANTLLVVLLGFVQFILTGFVPKDKLPKWLSPFILSVLIGVAVTVVGLTVGHLSLPDALAFFLGVTGTGNLIHQIKKPKTTTTPTA